MNKNSNSISGLLNNTHWFRGVAVTVVSSGAQIKTRAEAPRDGRNSFHGSSKGCQAVTDIHLLLHHNPSR